MQVSGASGVKALLKVIVDGLGWSGHVRKVLNAPGDVLLGPVLSPVYAHKARNLEGLLLIAGYGSSGSTLIGALLNAHPDAVVANEGRALPHVRLPGSTKGILVRRILRKERWECRRSKFYRGILSGGASYRVETGWQGRYARLRLVGAKNAGLNNDCLNDPALLDFLRRRLGCPLRVLFSYRNPYDMVATWCLRAPEGKGGGCLRCSAQESAARGGWPARHGAAVPPPPAYTLEADIRGPGAPRRRRGASDPA